MALTRKGWMSARNFAFDLQRGVYRVTGVVFVGASLYHAVGAMSVPVPPPDLLLYNEASAAYHTFFAALNAAFAAGLLLMEPPSALLARSTALAPCASKPVGTPQTGVRCPSLSCSRPWLITCSTIFTGTSVTASRAVTARNSTAPRIKE